MNELVKKVNFNIIRYANCWEDADVLLEGLSPLKESKILSIGSAGDNSFSLLTSNPEIVAAVDINKVQLYLIELKKTSIKLMDYEDVLAFLGFEPSLKRLKLFHNIKSELSYDARNYWEQNLSVINNGVIYAGKFEKYFILFSQKILPFIHSKKSTGELFKIKSETEQSLFYNNKWNNWRWKFLFKIFFSKYIMGKFGRDPAFLKQVDVSVAKYIYHKAGAHLQSVNAQHNFILHFNLLGNFGKLYPHYMRKENFELIKSNIKQLVFKECYAEQAVKYFGKFKYMNLSNIFEYMNEQTFYNTSKQLIAATEKEGKLAYWNLMVNRKVSSIFPDKVKYEKDISNKLTQKDKGFFYNQFIIDTINE